MRATELAQRSVAQGLDAQGEAVESRRAKGGQGLLGNGARVGFEAQFGIRGETEVLSDLCEELRDRIGGEQGRGAPAKKQGADRSGP